MKTIRKFGMNHFFGMLKKTGFELRKQVLILVQACTYGDNLFYLMRTGKLSHLSIQFFLRKTALKNIG